MDSGCEELDKTVRKLTMNSSPASISNNQSPVSIYNSSINNIQSPASINNSQY